MTITVYSKPACVQCAATIRKLDALGLAYELIDLTADAAAMERVTGWGFKSAPVVDADGERWGGFQPVRIKALAQGNG